VTVPATGTTTAPTTQSGTTQAGTTQAGTTQAGTTTPAPTTPAATAQAGTTTQVATTMQAGTTTQAGTTATQPTSGLAARSGPAELSLTAASFALSRRPRAGALFSASLLVLTAQTRARLLVGTVTCRARAGGRVLIATKKTLRRGVARCEWKLSKQAGGQLITGSIRVGSGRASVARAFRLRAVR